MSAVENLIDVRREDWLPRTARSVARVSFKDPSTRTKIEVHHGGSPLGSTDPVDAWRAYARYHIYSKKWSDIWYNLGVHPNGDLYELRGAYASNSARPYLAINLPGHGDYDSTEAQWDKIHALRSAFEEDTGSTDFGYHAERGGTICPGTKVISRIQSINLEGSPAMPDIAPTYPLAIDPFGPFTIPGQSGYYIIGSDGGVFTFGGVPYLGSLPAKVPEHNTLRDPITGFAPHVKGGIVTGYYLMSLLGAVFAFGEAPWMGRTERA